MKLTKKQQNEMGLSSVLERLLPDSPMGQEQKRRLSPIKTQGELEHEIGRLSAMLSALRSGSILFDKIRQGLMLIKPIHQSIKFIAEGTASDVDFFEVKRFLLQLDTIVPTIERCNPLPDIEIRALDEPLKILDPSGSRIATFSIESSWSEQLALIRRRKDTEIDNRAELAAMEEREQQRIRSQLCDSLKAHIGDIERAYHNLGLFDFIMAKARLALSDKAIIPMLGAQNIEFEGMYNPQIKSAVEQRGGEFCPINLSLEKGSTVITGANMGGKTVVLNTLALNVYLAHCAMAVYAQSARLPYLNEVLIIHEHGEGGGQGLSDFAMEMVQCKDALALAEQRGQSLLLFDELARGTNPFEGALIVRRTVRYCNKLDCYCLFTTHFDDVAAEAKMHYQIMGLKKTIADAVGVEAIAAHMDYTLRRAQGEAKTPRDALSICRLLGLPDELMKDIEAQYTGG